MLWTAAPLLENDTAVLRLHYMSKDGEEGVPGNLDITVTYWFTNANALRIEYSATTTKPLRSTSRITLTSTSQAGEAAPSSTTLSRSTLRNIRLLIKD